MFTNWRQHLELRVMFMLCIDHDGVANSPGWLSLTRLPCGAISQLQLKVCQPGLHLRRTLGNNETKDKISSAGLVKR